MAERSPIFGFTLLGPGDALSVEGYRPVRGNWLLAEQMLQVGIGGHHHSGEAAAGSVPAAPTAAASAAGGDLPPGTRLYYRISTSDGGGPESPASPTAEVDTPPSVQPPNVAGLVAVATGGAVPGGDSYYALSAWVGSAAEETAAPNVAVVTVPFGNTGVVTVTLPPLPAGADGFNIYARRPATASYGRIASIDMTVAPPTTFVDDGDPVPNIGLAQPKVSSIPPTASVDLAAVGLAPTESWKVYRTDDDDDWTNSLLATVAAGDATYTDTGTATGTGEPIEASTGLDSPEKIEFTDSAEVQGRLPLARISAFPFTAEFSYDGVLAPGPGQGVWVCPYPQATILGAIMSLEPGMVATADITANILTGSGPTPTYASIFTAGGRPTIPTGDQVSPMATPIVAEREMILGDTMRADLDVATNGENLTIIVHGVAYGWTSALSHVWAP